MMPTLAELLRYESDTGELYWLPRARSLFPDDRSWKTWNTRFSGQRALTALDSHGYRHGHVLGRREKAHRVAWAIAHGRSPDGQIDHINGDRHDNRLANLRDVSAGENRRNAKLPSNNTSGVVGVSFHRPSGRWRARIGRAQGGRALGLFATKEDAARARKCAERALGYHENHGRSQCQ